MSIFRYASSIYGNGDRLIGANWALISWFVTASFIFCAAHLILKLALDRRSMTHLQTQFPQGSAVRVMRHELIDRLYHWVMAVAIFVLLGTAFLPIVGVRFAWLNIHWITGVALSLSVVFHIVRSLFWQDWRVIAPAPSDLRIAAASIRGGRSDSPKPGKYNIFQKLYHLAIAVLMLTMVGTGLIMLFKIDTPFWPRNPYLLSSKTWGIIYVAHDFAAMAILSLVIIHIYFALRPDEWPYLRSMVRGWMSGREYADHHDPKRWNIPDRG